MNEQIDLSLIQSWDVTFEDVRRRQQSDIIRYTTPAERFAMLVSMLDLLKDHLPEQKRIESW